MHIKKLLKRNKWTLVLFYNGVQIKKMKIDKDLSPKEMVIITRIIGKKYLFRSNNIKVILRPKRLLKNDEQHNKTYWGCVDEIGVEI